MQNNTAILRYAAPMIVLAAGIMAVAMIASTPWLNGQDVVEERAEGRLVPGFPDLPMYPGAVVEESRRRTSGDRTGFAAELVSGDPVFDVYSFYLEALQQDGWNITFDSKNSPTAEEQGLGAAKDDLRLYMEFEMEDSGETEIEIEIPLRGSADGSPS